MKRAVDCAAVLLATLLGLPCSVGLVSLLGLWPSTAAAQPPPNISVADWQQRLGDTLPLRLSFRDEAGHVVPLAHYFGQRPVALVMMYLSCSQLCPVTIS
jgi:cytochrome oxidase Cu insertion factor (SCO1/SenC/PrrC family)